MKYLKSGLLALLLFSLVACAEGVTPPTQSVSSSSSPAAVSSIATTIGMSYIPNVQFAPFYVVQESGLLTSQGIQLRHHGEQEGLFSAIAAGQEDFVVAGGDEALQAREQGIDLVAIASYYRQYPVRVIAQAQSKITTLADLRGKKIGVPGRYGESWYGLLVAMKSANLTEKDLDIVEIGYTAAAALGSNKVDAVVGFVNNDLVQFRLAGMDVVEIALTDTGNPPLVGASVFTTRQFLEAHPDIAKAVADATVAGIAATDGDPAHAVQVTKSQVPGMNTPEAEKAARATLDATLEIMKVDKKISGKLDSKQWQAMADFLYQNGVLTKPADIEAAIAADVVSS